MFEKRSKSELTEIIESWNQRIVPEYRKMKYEKMRVSPYAFFRATNHLFWKDITELDLIKQFGSEKTKTWIQGDLHIFNFGSFENDRNEIVYDVNDFDESLLADYQFDLWRLATSIVLAVEEVETIKDSDFKELLTLFSDTYLDTLRIYSDRKLVETNYSTDTTKGKLNKFLHKVNEKQNRQDLLNKWVLIENNENKFNFENPKLKRLSQEKKEAIIRAIPAYKESLASELRYDIDYFVIKDIAERISSGLGSFGFPRYYILIDGNSKLLSDDRILDVKLQLKPTAYHFFTEKEKIDYDKIFTNEGWRHTAAYIAMHRHSNDHLGWIQIDNQFYSVNERSPYRNYFPVHKLKKTKHLKQMVINWATIIASNHVQSYNNFDIQTVIEQTYIQKEEFENLVTKIAIAYAKRTKEDWAMFCEHFKSQDE